ncbi:MAG: hypothetical protein HKN76_09485 [Saprospiraceae bacterium]|nr:hypothetical protein [Saprospiraceae bacterium]
MKILAVSIKSLLILSALFVFQSFLVSDGVVGTWKYQATNTAPEYASGEIIIDKSEDDFMVTLSVNYSKIKGNSVVVEDNQVKFNINVEGADVDVLLNFDGDNFTGEAQSDEGTYALKGKRKSMK